jgi:hypothetical protein
MIMKDYKNIKTNNKPSNLERFIESLIVIGVMSCVFGLYYLAKS